MRKKQTLFLLLLMSTFFFMLGHISVEAQQPLNETCTYTTDVNNPGSNRLVNNFLTGEQTGTDDDGTNVLVLADATYICIGKPFGPTAPGDPPTYVPPFYNCFKLVSAADLYAKDVWISIGGLGGRIGR